MSRFSHWVYLCLLLTLVGCNGSETTSESSSAETSGSVYQSDHQALSSDRIPSTANTTNQGTLEKKPTTAVEPTVGAAPAQESGPIPEIDKALQKEIARAKTTGSKQLSWLKDRLDRRVLAIQKQVQAVEKNYEYLRTSADQGEPKLAKEDQRKVGHLEAQASKIRSKLDRMSSRYTDTFLAMDPVAKGLRAELEIVEREKGEIRLAGIEKVLQQAHEDLTLAYTLERETKQENQRLVARFESLMSELENEFTASFTLETDPDFQKAEAQLISAWKRAYDLNESVSHNTF